MTTRNVVLTDHQDKLVNDLIASGRYQNASEALRAGLSLLEQEEAELDALRARLEEGLKEAHSGQRAEGTAEEVMRRAFARAKERFERKHQVG